MESNKHTGLNGREKITQEKKTTQYYFVVSVIL